MSARSLLRPALPMALGATSPVSWRATPSGLAAVRPRAISSAISLPALRALRIPGPALAVRTAVRAMHVLEKALDRPIGVRRRPGGAVARLDHIRIVRSLVVATCGCLRGPVASAFPLPMSGRSWTLPLRRALTVPFSLLLRHRSGGTHARRGEHAGHFLCRQLERLPAFQARRHRDRTV